MAPETWRSVRWLVALGACILVVLVSVPLALDAVTNSVVFGGESASDEEDAGQDPAADEAALPEPPPGPPSGPVTDGEAAPDVDAVVTDGALAQTTDAELVLDAEGSLALLVFPRIEGDPACVTSAELGVELTAAEATELAVYAATSPPDVEDGVEVDDPRVDGEVRALAVTDGSPGRLRWDVSGLYRSWASGELGPVGGSFAVAVAPPAGTAAVTFAASESDVPPSLVWDGDEDCPG